MFRFRKGEFDELTQQETKLLKLWAEKYFEDKYNTFLVLREVLKDFRSQTGLIWNSPLLKTILGDWCDEQKLKLNPPETLDNRGRCRDELSTEYCFEQIYIKG